jgi:uncharacterized protein YgbK (DUF1537 family)
LREEAEYDVVVVDTESRNVNPDEARKLVKKAVFELLPLWGEAIFYKKVDSTCGEISHQSYPPCRSF